MLFILQLVLSGNYMLYTLISYNIDFKTKAIYFVCYLLALIVGFTVHEYAHARTAVACGDPTPKLYGRCTLNPLAHIDVGGFLSFILLGFGWAKPVPINVLNFQSDYKRKTFLVSIMGVLFNIAIAFVFIVLGNLWLKLDAFNGWGFEFFIYFFPMFIQINLILFIFNLIPIYPLDGFNAISAYLRYENKFVLFMRKYGPMILWGMLIVLFVVEYIWDFSLMGTLVYYVGYPMNWLVSKIFGLPPYFTSILLLR